MKDIIHLSESGMELELGHTTFTDKIPSRSKVYSRMHSDYSDMF